MVRFATKLAAQVLHETRSVLLLAALHILINVFVRSNRCNVHIISDLIELTFCIRIFGLLGIRLGLL